MKSSKPLVQISFSMTKMPICNILQKRPHRQKYRIDKIYRVGVQGNKVFLENLPNMNDLEGAIKETNNPGKSLKVYVD
jgi:hypothetical protein